VKTAAFKVIDDDTLDMIVLPWKEPGGKAAFYRQIAQANSSYTDEVQPLYSQVSKPVLILWGREDTWIPSNRGELLHEMIPNSLFHVIPDAGHLVIEEQPEQLVGKIRPFLRHGQIT
jgi:pimeloyl-ACP methyl ester carboxylesterase